MNYHISAGGYRLRSVESVKITSSVLNLADVATVNVAIPYGRKNEVTDKIKAGDAVTIRLGYGELLQTEFEGYLKSIQTEGNGIILDCMDELYLLDKTIADREYKNTSTKALVSDWLRQAGVKAAPAITVNATWNKYRTFKTTALDALKKIQDETKCNVYFSGGVLHIHAPYEEKSGNEVIFDTARNIEASDLKYVLKSDKKVQIEVRYISQKGKTKTAKFGQSGGVVQTVATTGNDLKGVAERTYSLWNYDGFEGSFTGWLVPVVRPTDTVVLRDGGKAEGRYYVTGTEVEFGAGGGKRKVTVGRRLL
jgi:hypothetical protein